ncbi:hypothetical protein [Chryseobacterium echinoideorum]|uniref:hypothetical protein n=1 Tax=Chryseobacterium echinoideorum TaxID=1549648 RepID=UPI001E3AE040|nr:hypothetical protein [Chryseobacterium echinoideorum]
MNNDKFQDKYNEVFQSLKEEKMNWDFDDFLKKAESKETKSSAEIQVIPLQNKKPSFPKWFWMAASVIIIFGLVFIFNPNQNKITDKENLVKNEVLKQKNEFIAENHNHNLQVATHVTDSVSGTKKDSLFQENTLAESDVLDEILSKKSRIKKERKPKYVYNNSQTSLADSLGYKDSYVIVNGKRIDNVEEAINVTKYSFQVMATNVNQALSTKVMDNVE